MPAAAATAAATMRCPGAKRPGDGAADVVVGRPLEGLVLGQGGEEVAPDRAGGALL